jgi:hypothetical protein
MRACRPSYSRPMKDARIIANYARSVQRGVVPDARCEGALQRLARGTDDTGLP